MKIILNQRPQGGLHGTLQVPGDKSLSHRGLILGAISTGTTTLRRFLPAADCLATLTALQALGVPIKRQGTTVTVTGVGLQGLRPASAALDLKNAGTATRLLTGLLAGQAFDSHLIGDASLSRRPMARVQAPLAKFGARVQTTSGHLPLTIHGRQLHAAQVRMTVASAQVKSALILAALQAPTASTIVEKQPTRDHTERLLRQFGGRITTAPDQRTIVVDPGARLHGCDVTIPGDPSSAAFWLAAATIVPKSRLRLTNVGLNPTRLGFLRILKRMGGRVTVTPHTSATTTAEPVGDLLVSSAELNPVQLTAADIPAVIDELPLVALLAATANGVSTIRGAAELRFKETDRIATIVTELRKLGVAVTPLADGLIIDGRQTWQRPTTAFDSHGDHRIGMMMAVAALRLPAPVALVGAQAWEISYPAFLTDLQTVCRERVNAW